MGDAQDRHAALVPGDEFRLVMVSAPDAACAKRLAEGAVQGRLAACVTQLPGALSTYRWQGAIEESEEVLLLIKTSAKKLEELGDWIRLEHPYDVPEFLSFPPAEVDRAYAAWLSQSC
jgi:periplasmic divalent cation tolerance protein